MISATGQGGSFSGGIMARKANKTKQAPAVMHLIKGRYRVKWHASERAMRAAARRWPPSSSGGCKLRASGRNHPLPWCENISCDGRCILNAMPGSGGKLYWFCICRRVSA
jgi:hypothetical protein